MPINARLFRGRVCRREARASEPWEADPTGSAPAMLERTSLWECLFRLDAPLALGATNSTAMEEPWGPCSHGKRVGR